MNEPATASRTDRDMASRYCEVRSLTEELAAPLGPEDQTVQSMPDTSPTKWHRAHTSWFFETFVLEPSLEGYQSFDPSYRHLFNSYYEAVGPRHTRSERGLITRPGVSEIAQYRLYVDQAVRVFLAGEHDDASEEDGLDPMSLVELGLHHEQQHQELLLMDIKHLLFQNPAHPAYMDRAETAVRSASAAGWWEHPGGLVEVGHSGSDFSFDNERPRHVTYLTPFAIANRPVDCGQWLAFMEDGGYSRPDLWLSEGWANVQGSHWEAPLYWTKTGLGWEVFTLGGQRPINEAEPVCHVSYFEADAFARWAGARLPTESEWEAVAGDAEVKGNFLDISTLHPKQPATAADDRSGIFGEVWQWTSTSYGPHPGFEAPGGAVGEYNGKFMVNQYVLKGGCCATPDGHLRASYRNFFPASSRWAFSGVRLAISEGGDPLVGQLDDFR